MSLYLGKTLEWFNYT